MAFQLVSVSALDETQAQFAFDTVGGNFFLKFGLLNSKNRGYVADLDPNERVGFYQGETQVAQVQILSEYNSSDGLRISAIPALTVGQSYQIRFTQSETEGEGSGGESGTQLALADFAVLLQAETLSRQTEDTNLGERIDAEVSARIAGDQALQRNIGAAVNPASVLSAIQAMSDTQKAAARDALGAAIIQPPTELTYTGTSYDMTVDLLGYAFYIPAYMNVAVHIGAGRFAQYNALDGSSIIASSSNPFSTGLPSGATFGGADVNSADVDLIYAVDARSAKVRLISSSSFTVQNNLDFDLNWDNDNARGVVHVGRSRELWVLDGVEQQAYRYLDYRRGAFNGKFDLHRNNGSPQDATYVPDLRQVFVLDVVDKMIYRYWSNGDFVGAHTLHTDNSDPRGIVYVPPNHKLWVPDRTAGKAFLYDLAA